jgi:hypothetical protein
MRGDQLARQWQVIEASPNGLTMAEIAMADGAHGAKRKGSPSKACSKSWNGLFCYPEEAEVLRSQIATSKTALFRFHVSIGAGRKK